MLVAEFTNRNKDDFKIYRSKPNEWYVHCNGRIVQKELNEIEIVRYLANALEGK